MKKPSILLFLIFVIIVLYSACRKDNLISNDPGIKLSFSTDTVIFDTVFTTIGSSTRQLMVYNSENKTIKISSIRLAGGPSSKFRINIDGISSTSAKDIEIAPKDSMYIFVEVTVDPNNLNNPLIITDSIIFLTNGNYQDVDLIAWGQDANFILADTYISGLPPFKIVAKEGETKIWTNDKPYVIYGYAVVDSVGQLIINQGCKIHFHNNSGLWIYKGGSLKVNGTKNNPVTFQGDRLEQAYKDLPGQWDRIWINEGSVDNEINYAIIKNGFIGIQAETFDSKMGNKLILNNTIITQMSGAGILTRDYKIIGSNLLITNCGQYALALSRGGDYEFKHCTFANYWGYTARQVPTIILNNYYEKTKNQFVYFDLNNAYFGNCIIYGNIEEEISLDKYSSGGIFNYKFDHCLLKTKLPISNATFYNNCKKNLDPKFVDVSKKDYHIKIDSPAKDAGNAAIIIPLDLDEKTRDALPDMGAYEYKPI